MRYGCYGARMTTDDRPELLTRQEAARRLRVSLSTMQRMTQAGTIRSIRVGRGVRIPAADVDAIISGEAPAAPVAAAPPEHMPNYGTWPPTPSMLAELDGRPTADEQQAEDDAQALRAARRITEH